MDWDERAQKAHDNESLAWAHTFNGTPPSDIAKWISTFRNGYTSEFVGNMCGSFNWSCRIRFNDGLQWVVRFAVPGKVMNGDEKMRREVITMQFIKTKTTIPAPSVIAWGCTSDNPLGLGPYIIMDFIEGQHLDQILRYQTEDGYTLKSDVGDRELEIIYRQLANIYLELSAHDFLCIGALSSSTDTGIRGRPMTLKINEIENHRGIRVMNQTRTPQLRTIFFGVAEQDWQHLLRQPNSVDDSEDARSKYLYNRIFRALIPSFVAAEHNYGPFKLICDDLRFGNILVNNEKDLKIIAVLDWEWVYAAPYQILFSPPRWLLIKRPSDWDDTDISRYKGLLKRFIDILNEEDSKRATRTHIGVLMQQSWGDGMFWFHELVYSCFGSPEEKVWSELRKIFPSLDTLATLETSDSNRFVNAKIGELDRYNVEWAMLKEKVDREKADFEAKIQKVIGETGDLEIPAII